MQNCSTVGISFTNDILTKIDANRGLIPRSVYLREILKKIIGHEIRLEELQNQKQVEPLHGSVVPSPKGELRPNG